MKLNIFYIAGFLFLIVSLIFIINNLNNDFSSTEVPCYDVKYNIIKDSICIQDDDPLNIGYSNLAFSLIFFIFGYIFRRDFR